MASDCQKRFDQKPQPRSGHVALAVGKFMLVWGGYYDRNDGTAILEERYMPPDEVWVYHTDVEKWHCQSTTGETPPGSSGACATVINNHIYILGGHTDAGNTSEVYCLDINTWQWAKINIDDIKQKPSPRDKFAAWEYQNRIYIFGGFGLPIHKYLNEHGDFFLDTSTWSSSRGWNNQVHVFDPEKNTWTNLDCKGPVPTPRAAHATVRLGENMYLFGGRHNTNRTNDLHCLNLTSMTWSGRLLTDGDIPIGRSWHSLTTVSEKHIFLFGGYSQTEEPLSDAWLLNTETLQWLQLSLPKTSPRLWHTGCSTVDGDILIFGGCRNNILNVQETTEHTNQLLVFRCSPKSLLRLCLDTTFDARDHLQSDWQYLPKNLYQILKIKLEGYNNTKDIGKPAKGSDTLICSIS